MAIDGGFYVGPGTGRSFDFGQSRLEVKAGPEAGLAFGVFRSSFPAGAGMPFLHLHRSYDETFYVIGSEIEFVVGTRQIRATGGGAVLVPRGVAHCFRNAGPDDAHWIVVTAPAVAVTMIEELAQLRPGELDRFAEILERHDSELLERHPHWDRPAPTRAPV